jgi:BirA family biotin operon repressor/biotin-[acetyl-CoA-carboxylase] ligase
MTSELDKTTLLQQIDNGLFPGGVHLFDCVDSTNEWAGAELRQGRATPFVCIADQQSKGRGRRGRHWISPPGANIYLSIAWHFALPAEKLGLLSLAQGVAVIRALTNSGVNGAWLKWPNDVFVKHNKIAGILVETSQLRASSCNVVIGIGVNYRMPVDAMPESGIRWTDVVHAGSGPAPDRNSLAIALITEAVTMCDHYQKKALSIFEELQGELGALTGKDVNLHLDSGEQLSGTVLGINQRGELRVRVHGHERVFNSADVSLRQVHNADN